MTRVLAFSDLHHSRTKAEDLVAAAAEADLVIGAGDFCNMRSDLPGAMTLLAGIRAPMVLVPGNAESAEELSDAAPAGATVLHGGTAEQAGLKLAGLGYAVPRTPFGDWSCDLDEAEAAALLTGVDAADVLISHSPPKGVGDRTSAGQSVGSTAVRDWIERVQPRLAVCGHVHDSWGVRGRIGATEVVNLGPTPNWFDL
ncbi:MAG: metallophosphoesterase [Pseudomonadota bacterium]